MLLLQRKHVTLGEAHVLMMELKNILKDKDSLLAVPIVSGNEFVDSSVARRLQHSPRRLGDMSLAVQDFATRVVAHCCSLPHLPAD